MKRPSMKDIIADTMMEILEHTRLTSITINAVCDDIGISNRTFYNYYKDKYEVCNYIYDRIADNECWYENGKRVNLKKYTENWGKAIWEKYPEVFEHMLSYTGQNCLKEHMIDRGVDDLIQQLKYTGHSELLSSEYIHQFEFYTKALVNNLVDALGNKNKLYDWMIVQDKTQYLSRMLYDALTAEPIHAPELHTHRRNKH